MTEAEFLAHAHDVFGKYADTRCVRSDRHVGGSPIMSGAVRFRESPGRVLPLIVLLAERCKVPLAYVNLSTHAIELDAFGDVNAELRIVYNVHEAHRDHPPSPF